MAGYGYSYRGDYKGYKSDHVSQSVFSDADGRRKPIISSTPTGDTDLYVTKTETVEVPLVTGYNQSTPVQVEVLVDYADGEGKWNRPSSPEKSHSSSSPVRYHAKEKWNRPSSPVHAEVKWNRPQGEELNTKKPTEASRPNNPQSATYWRQAPKPLSTTGGWTIREYQESSGYTGGAWAKPSHGAWSAGQGNLSNPTNDIDTAMEYLKEAIKQPSSGMIPPPYRYTIPASTGPKRDANPETIDSREAERRYGGLASRPTITIDSREAERRYGGLVSHPTMLETERRYGVLASHPTITIDSTEAERRYGGLASRPTITIDNREAAKKYGGTIV